MKSKAVTASGVREVRIGGACYFDSNPEKAKWQCMKVPDGEVVYEVARDLQQLPIRIKKMRVASGFTQTEAGEMLGMGRERIRQYESGVSIPSVPMLLIFAAFYGVSLDWLCGKDEW